MSSFHPVHDPLVFTALVTAGLMVTPCLWKHQAPLNQLVAANTCGISCSYQHLSSCLQPPNTLSCLHQALYPACSNKHYLYQPPLSQTLLAATNTSLQSKLPACTSEHTIMHGPKCQFITSPASWVSTERLSLMTVYIPLFSEHTSCLSMHALLPNHHACNYLVPT